MEPRTASRGWVPLLLANLLVLATLLYAGVLEDRYTDFYNLSSQEDEYIEWATVWAFLAATVLFAVAARRQLRVTRKLPWFLAGVALFSFFVAMEEISWGQRVFGYRPPVYFLEHNFQQELNVHNVVDTDYRKLALKGAILGYGVALPLLALVPGLGRRLRELAVEPPPVALAPAFLATYLTYEIYPWSFAGEWVELMLGGCMLFSALAILGRSDEAASPRRARGLAARIAVAWVAVLLLGVVAAAATSRLRRGSPEVLAAAKMEVEALGRDLAGLRRACQGKRSVHKRVYSYVEKYGEEALFEGEFAGLVAQGLPEDRALYFLDPWNSPYWFRCLREGRDRVASVYSFGPNRRRESTRTEILGDDVGVFVEGAR